MEQLLAPPHVSVYGLTVEPRTPPPLARRGRPVTVARRLSRPSTLWTARLAAAGCRATR
jgi:hypothetical protein